MGAGGRVGDVLTIFSYSLYSKCSGIWVLDPEETATPRATHS